MNFLVQMAADYFRDESSLGEYSRLKADLDIQAKALERQAHQSRTKRRELEKALEDCAARLNSDEPQEVVEAALAQLARAAEGAALQSNPDAKLRLILEAERTARSELAELRSGLRVAQPRGFALSRALRRDLAANRTEYAKIESEVLGPAYMAIEDIVSDATRDLEASRRRRFDAAAADAWISARRTVTAKGRASREQLSKTGEEVTVAVRRAIADLESELNEISQRVQRTDLSSLADSKIVQLRLDFDSEIEAIASMKEAQLEAIAEQLRAIVVDPDDSGQIITQVDVAGAVEENCLPFRSERTQTWN